MKHESHENSGMSRRRMVSLMFAGVAAATGACAPAKILWHLYPEDFDTRPGLVDKILRAFYDEFYPIRPHRNFIAAELCSRSIRIFGVDSFADLPYEKRVQVIQSAMEADKITVKLFTGAIMLTQVSCYGGMYDPDDGCDLIDFHGTYRLRPLSETTYPEPKRFFAVPSTVSGNAA
jgi:hypothetical protein